jgi:F0F1-type ATP synthase membrane subunit b/b'
MLNRIENDRKKLKEAKEKEAELEEKTKQAKMQNEELLSSSREKAEEIIKEAQKMAQDIKVNSKEKSDKKIEEKTNNDSQNSSHSNFNLSSVADLFNDLDIKKKASKYFFKRLMEDARRTLPKNPNLKKFVLEYASPIPPDNWAELKSFVIRAFGEDASLEEKENKSLIAGYRLIAGNKSIDQNIAYEIKNETREAE